MNKEQALLGLHDFFHEGEWLTILGEPLTETGYAEWTTKWYGPQPDNYQGQNCGALVIHGGMDDVFCHEEHHVLLRDADPVCVMTRRDYVRVNINVACI